MLNLVANGPSGYNLTNSLRFRSSATAYLSRTFASTGTNNKIQTFSAWVKRGLLSSSTGYRLMGGYNGSANYSTEINFINDNLRVEFGGSVQYELKTTQVFRDPSAWYHIVVAIDTTQATSSNRVKMYVNGNQITAFATANYPAQNDGSQLTSANANNKLGASWSNAEPFDGYMAEINFIDGQALTPSSFGSTNSTTGVWQPAKYTGTYGTNGFYLNFSNIALTSGSNTGLGKDYSGNGNYWNTNNISVTAGSTYDAMTDVPTLTSATVANYGTWNPLNAFNTTTTDGNLGFSMSANNTQSIQGTFGMTSGKWYFEYSFTSAGVVSLIGGIVGAEYTASGTRPYQTSTGYMYISSGNKINSGSGSAYGSTYTTNDIIGVAVDLDNGKIWFSKNGTWQASGDPAAGTNPAYTGLSGTYVPSVTNGNDGVTYAGWINCGQRPFTYTPPTGFNRLNTYNLPTSTIVQGNKYMDATLWTGNGATQTITNAASFKPDFVWTKGRTAYGNYLFDSVRGATNYLISELTDAEATGANSLTSFNSNGFSLGSQLQLNRSTYSYVGWQWQAGQGSTSSNTNGSITSTVSVNASAGFSIVTYTGTGANATVGHGLGVAPKMIFFKQRNAVRGWIVYNAFLANASTVIYLNVSNAANTDATAFNATAPTSSVFSVGTSADTNQSTGTYVAYCWAEIAGFSKFGSYTGNGSTDGPFVYLGFRPKFVLTKRTDSSTNGFWNIYDSARNGYNDINNELYPNSSSAEDSSIQIELLSNGFKCINTLYPNTSGGTYIYAAFAEHPFKNSNAR